MPVLSPQQFQADIKARAILYFSEPVLNTPIPHYFVCVGQSVDGELLFSCCTSQFETVRGLIERRRYLETTLVYMSPADTDNPFTSETYVNCNEYFAYSIQHLWNLYLHGQLSFYGELPLHSFEQILIGFRDSNQIEEEIKDALPNIDDL